jgi:hypothetical protein
MATTLYFSFQPPVTANVLGNLIRRVIILFNPASSAPRAPTGRRSGGAGRGPLCPAYLNTAIQAIVLVQSGDKVATQATVSDLVWGRTIAAHPTLWFYVPYQAGELQFAKFVVLDENQQLVTPSPVILTLKDTPGIVSVRLPMPLSIDQSYRWYFSIVCSTEKPSRNPGVRGWIERVEPSQELQAALRSTDTALAYRAYAEQGIWYDMVTDLMKQRQSRPKDSELQADWLGLLELLNASTLENVRISPCCESSSS